MYIKNWFLTILTTRIAKFNTSSSPIWLQTFYKKVCIDTNLSIRKSIKLPTFCKVNKTFFRWFSWFAISFFPLIDKISSSFFCIANKASFSRSFSWSVLYSFTFSVLSAKSAPVIPSLTSFGCALVRSRLMCC